MSELQWIFDVLAGFLAFKVARLMAASGSAAVVPVLNTCQSQGPRIGLGNWVKEVGLETTMEPPIKPAVERLT